MVGSSAVDRMTNSSYQIVIEGTGYRERLFLHPALLSNEGVIDPQTTTCY